MNIILKNTIRFIVLVLIQVAILNNIQVSGFLNPYMYVLFILLLPFETPNWLLLSLSFLLGFSVDIFSGTLGMHASACVFMGYVRPYVLNYLSLRDGYEIGTYPGISYYGFAWFFKYALVLVVAHHSFLFIIEAFSFANFSETMVRIIFSSFFSLTLLVTSQFLMFKK
ncbi:rod shape-determining protein MreD [Marinifilum sp. N1E240]|uniref:rod shape-determining protein MreD n=1 Tax=Marinifilum sp. N1E240 TaxID=2608082 RepID=UPI00128BDBE6|nr:rod shape-determining protein MreD [Marinifilum sp. N1E240]MPQ45638.1 rod shape-determining protein MreD [Marinifilum sp. N1E240]